MKGKYIKFLLFTILSCLSFSTVYAAKGHLTINLGGYEGLQGNTQHINIIDLIGDTFTVDDRHDQNALIGLGYFFDGNAIGHANMSYGINAFYLAPTSVSGNVIQEDLFNNLSYHYNIINFPVYVIAKSTFNLKSPLAFSIDVGIGPNFMKTYGFQESSLDGGVTIPDTLFSANTTTTFSATIGASFRINHALGQLPLEIGYRFFYLGQGYFNIDNNQVLNKLKTGNVYVNALIFSTSI
jgi:hypothetical protein